MARAAALAAAAILTAGVRSTQLRSHDRVRAGPRIFVYDLPASASSGAQLRDDASCEGTQTGAQLDCLFGEEFEVDLGPGGLEGLRLRRTWQFALGRIFHARLLGHPRRVNSPEEADLFYVPSWTASGLGGNCPGPEELRGLLPFLDNTTARRHVVLSPRVAWGGETCPFWHLHDAGTVGTLPRPEDAALFQETLKLAIEDPGVHPGVEGAHVHSVPYPGLGSGLGADMAARLREAAEPGRPRRYLAASVMSPRGARPNIIKGGMLPGSLREDLERQCADSAEQCLLVRPATDGNLIRTHGGPAADMPQIAAALLQATFCLQPPGDTPSRKGLVDAIALGCVPVLFVPAQARLWPWHVGRWEELSVMLSPREPDVLGRLRELDTKRVARLRAAVARAAEQLVYAPHGGTDDAIEVALAGAWRLASSPARWRAEETREAEIRQEGQRAG